MQNHIANSTANSPAINAGINHHAEIILSTLQLTSTYSVTRELTNLDFTNPLLPKHSNPFEQNTAV